MKCLILAAGRGSRLSGKGEPKPLVSLLGLTFIERVILTSRKAGINDFYVVTGYEGEKVRRYLDKFSQGTNIHITHIINEEWEKENGISVLKAKEVINEPFILLMADHIFDYSILNSLIKEQIADGEIILAVDRNIKSNKLVDIDDVTKVLVNKDKIISIGKNIKDYNAYDTGIFLCSPALFQAIEDSFLSTGDGSLSGGIRIISDNGYARIFDIQDNYWIDVDDEKAFSKAKKLLQNKLIKPADGIISRYINRKFSIKIFTPLLLKIYRKITPNQVTLLSFIIGLTSSLSFFLGNAILGGLLIQISSIMDGSDGEIARLKYMQSSLGDFVDAVLDRYADGFILLGIFYYSLSEIGQKDIWGIYWSHLIIISIFGLAILGHLMVSYSSAKSVVNFGYRYKGKWIAAGKGRDLRLFLLFIGGIMTYFNPIFILLAMFLIAIQTNTIVIWRFLLSYNYFQSKNPLIRNKMKAVIFDFDGTIADTMPFLTELAVVLITKSYNITKVEAKRRYLETTGIDFAGQLELIFPNHTRNHEVAATFESKKLESIFAHPVFSDVVPTLKYISNKKIKTFICSSTKQEIITKYARLNKIHDLTDGFFGYKPDFEKSEQIQFVLQHCKMQPDEVLFVGDSLRDYDLAKDKKIKFIGISKIFKKIEFQKKGALSVSCLTELVKLFDKSEKYFKSIERIM